MNFGPSDRLAFHADYYDSLAEMVRKFEILFYPYDNSFELVDMTKARRLFLRRTRMDDIKMKDLYIGSVLNILSRQLKVTGFADDYTQKILGTKLEQTFFMIKPDAMEKKGSILDMIYAQNLRVVRLKMVCIAREQLAMFFQEHRDKDFFESLLNYVSSSPILIMEISGNNSVEIMKELCGPEDANVAKSSAPLSIRARWGVDSLRNCVHVSENSTLAARELDFFFGPNVFTAGNTAKFQDCTMAIIKPHAVKEGLMGQVLNSIEAANFEISAMLMIHLSRANAEEFFEVYKGVLAEYNEMVSELCSGPCLAMEIRAQDAPLAFRELAGPYDPEIARNVRPKTLRARFGRDKVKNALHCTDLPDDANLEVDYFFKILDKPAMVE